MKQRTYIGFGTLDSLGERVAEFSPEKILVVSGGRAFELSGARKRIEEQLPGGSTSYFDDFSPNPKMGDVLRAIEFFRRSDSQLVIAVGGGSVIDMAKMMNFFGSNGLDPESYVSDEKRDYLAGAPVIAVPTTAGSGSEATHFAVMYIGNDKCSVDHQSILPEIAIIDPSLCISMPARITASTGMDALAQAVESYWCINSDAISKEYASRAMRLAVANLVPAVQCPSERSRLAMSEAAHLAGKAINITKTTAPHAVSYPLTSLFGILHGHAVGLVLPSMFVYNADVSESDVLDSRGCEYVRQTIREIAAILGAADAHEAAHIIERIMRDIGLETEIASLGIAGESEIEMVVERGFNPGRVKNNPRKLTKKALRTILRNIQGDIISSSR